LLPEVDPRGGALTRASWEELDGAADHGDESDGGRELGESQASAAPRVHL